MQVGLVRVQQPFPVWVQGAPIYIKATSAEPAPLAWLGDGTELHIAPRPRRSQAAAQQPHAAPTAAPARQPAAAPLWLRVQVLT